MKSNIDIGLEACGSSGVWDICVDTEIQGDRLWIEIEHRLCSFRFEITQHYIKVLIDCINGDNLDDNQIGTFANTPVMLRKDTEFNDRFYLIIHTGNETVDCVIAGQDLIDFREAMKQVKDDLDT